METTKILIVEDELLIGKNISNKLKKLGYTTTQIVSSGKAALQSVENIKPDLILMDIAIKGNIDGIETAAKIRDLENIPIIFLTAYADDATLEKASKTGCYGYIVKPFKEKDLHATIKIVLNKHREETTLQESLQETINQYSCNNDNIYTDSLTQLPNRLFLRDLFQCLLAKQNYNFDSTEKSDKAQKNQKSLAIIYFDLDRFEKINLYLDSHRKDLLIGAIANKLAHSVYNFEGEGAIARLQNSEFAIILANIQHQQTVIDFAKTILDQINRPFVIEEQEVFSTASIGISFYPFNSLEIEQLLHQAKQAMQYAHQQGGNRSKQYTAAFKLANYIASDELRLETELHQALKRQELELVYQPKIDLSKGKIVSAEALLRWNHPRRGLMLPDKFIHIAEETNLIESIGEWVLSAACQQTKAWHQAGLDFFKVAVNISGKQFKQLDLFYKLSKILFDSKLNPQALELEITEKCLVENVKGSVQRLNLIKNLGIQIALDDFGTGYSSLAFLQQFPLDILKIDQCFIRNIDQNPTNAVITASIIQMAHQLGLKVVAEGIETAEELAFLQQHNCNEAQGYLFGVPLPAKEFQHLILNPKIFTIKSLN